MGAMSLLSALFVLQLAALSIGEPAYNRQYRLLYEDPYYTYKYYTNPYRYTYPSSYNSDDKVYITDKYGQTTSVTSSARLAARARALSYDSPVQTYTSYSEVCTSGTCGQNAQCSVVSGRPVCSCLRGYTGDPISHCRRVECTQNSECRGHQACKNEHCINPCEGACGVGADCLVRNHVPVCSCPEGTTGDPFNHCRQFYPEELCHPSPCGPNTDCEVVNQVPTCRCLPGYHGSPLSGCRHECESDSECGPNYACIEFRCQNPCAQCGQNAECETVRNHVPICKCPRGYYGNPLLSCQPECTSHSDCPSGKPACYYNSCKNPCDGVCGINANCELRGLTPICSCPKDKTGDPFVMCRPFEARDLCEPNPCGANARCQPGFDKYDQERPVCTCHSGYVGDPITGCLRGECTADDHCSEGQACIDYKCQNPCLGQCGVNANCNPRRHLAVCTCPAGYSGDALSQCYRVESTAVARYLRF